MSSDGFSTAAKLQQISDPGKLVVEVDGQVVVLIRYGQEVYCVDDVCTHDGGTLGDGELQGNCLICPRHGAMFDVRTGEALSMPATEPTLVHEVRLVGDAIQVRLRNS